VNRRAETEIQSMSQRMSLLMDKMEDMENLVRQAVDPEDEKKPHHGESEAGV